MMRLSDDFLLPQKFFVRVFIALLLMLKSLAWAAVENTEPEVTLVADSATIVGSRTSFSYEAATTAGAGELRFMNSNVASEQGKHAYARLTLPSCPASPVESPRSFLSLLAFQKGSARAYGFSSGSVELDCPTTYIEFPLLAEAERLLFRLELLGKGTLEGKIEVGFTPPTDRRGAARLQIDAEIERVLNFIRSVWLFAEDKTLDLAAWAEDARRLSVSASRMNEIMPAITYLAQRLRQIDQHSVALPASLTTVTAGYTFNTALPSLEQQVCVARLTVPAANFTADNEKTVQQAHRYVAAAWSAIEQAGQPCAWLIDLRENSGGSAAWMQLALAPLLDRAALATVWFGKNQAFPVTVSDHHVEQAGKLMAQVPSSIARPHPSRDIPVYVLISRKTGSAGEAVAIGFKCGRDALFVGDEPSAGKTTANESLKLANGTVLAVTAGYMGCLDGRQFRKALEPDLSLNTLQERLAMRLKLVE